MGWEVRLTLDSVHNELSGQGGDRKQQKPWGRNPGFHLLVLISELWFEEYHPICCQQSGRENVVAVFLCHLYFHQCKHPIEIHSISAIVKSGYRGLM